MQYHLNIDNESIISKVDILRQTHFRIIMKTYFMSEMN